MPWGRNQSAVPTGRDAGSGTTEPCEAEKLVSRGREARDLEEEESCVVREQTSSRRREDEEEEASGWKTFAVTQEAERGTPATLLEKHGTIPCISLCS
ncbi:hypothetical protein NDU88_004077 [Pleurodeles waltl]|uniref:Uncharacterized protein n=1 Tax=Pleurodeles waltl TaxID=8319 RepID=A0AAV7MTJ8_PLEWA|nr:hypothetical protein NDU88_004077 [Pleurodeles waltl]